MKEEKLISERAKAVEISVIRQFSNLVAAVPGALSLTIGQPDFNTPEKTKKAGIKAIENNKTTYTHNMGDIEIRRAISEHLKRRFNILYDPDKEIIMTAGSTEALDITFRTFINDGDEVLIPSPGFVAYASGVKLAGGKPVYIPLYEEDKFRLKPEAIINAITDRTKFIILSYPNNPTGAIMEREDLEAVAKVVREHDLVVVTDEVYESMTYGKKHFSIVQLEGMKERTVLIGGFSKAYSMTGWRLGYTVAPEWMTKHLVKLHQYSVTCAVSISQQAGITAINECGEDVSLMVEEYRKRRDICSHLLREMKADFYEPEGAFYIFISIKNYGISSDEFCKRLLYEEKLALVPGSAFGDYGEGYVRLSYAYSVDVLKEGFRRLAKFLDKIR